MGNVINKAALKGLVPDGDDKPKKASVKLGKRLKTQYGKYSGIVTDKGEVDSPTELEVLKNTAAYMKNNRSPQSDNPSNVYRPENSHIVKVHNRKEKQTNA